MKDAFQPEEASAGANNGKYIYCDAFNERKKYFVCLHTLAAIERGSVKENSPSSRCMRVCNSDQCTASRYRKEEKAAGRAIYFELDPYHAGHKPAEARPKATLKVRPRFNLNLARPSLSYESKSPVNEHEAARVVAPKNKPAKEKGLVIESMDLGRLVTDLAASETAIEAAKKVAVETAESVVTATQSKPQRLPGESLVEMAKRLIKEKQQ